ncbi:MAG: heme-binding domain-containing protein [Chitinophagaceae bacterium]
MIRKILLALLVLLIIIQFFRPTRNYSATLSPNDITRHFPVPADVHQLLSSACFDCHSNNTKYPWYYHIQPIAWWMNNHINDGKHSLNFSEFGSYTRKRMLDKLKNISKLVKNHGMPISSYTWEHPEGRLTPAQISRIAGWADSLRAQISQEPH